MTNNDFQMICRQIANLFKELAETYEKDQQQVAIRLDEHSIEIVKTNETKRKILEILQEDLNG